MRILTRFFLPFFVLSITGCAGPTPATDIRLPTLFTNHMVLQRDAPISVWGWASPKGTVRVSLNDQAVTAVAGADSSWQLNLPALPAGGPYTLTVSGIDTLIMNDVLVGEVWVASGQSNMEWSVQASNDPDNEIAAAAYPNIRLFKVARSTAYAPQQDVEAVGWQAITPTTIPSFSAVAYYFGRRLHQDLNIPIGLIQSAWGGTPAEAWTSGPALMSLADFEEEVATLSEALDDQGKAMTFQAQREAWLQKLKALDEGYQGDAPRWVGADVDHTTWATMPLPQLWESGGLEGYDGIVWFRTTVDLPPSWADQEATLNLSMVDDRDTTWVNGVKVGHTDVYNAPRRYTIPAGVLDAGPNTITVRVLDTGGGGGIWGEAADMTLTRGTETISLAGPWSYRPGIAPGEDLPRPPKAAQHTPTTLYNAMIAPLTPYTIRGAIWYQGESNASRAYQYRALFRTMIEDWRAQWSLGDFPFYFVQLANFMKAQERPVEEETWPELREAQSMALTLPNTAQAVIIDIGEADDIHPRNKQDVGTRLALAALNQTYEQDVVFSGPTYKSMTKENDTFRLTFEHVGGGLIAQGNDLRGFAIAGEDHQFVWADARIEGETIVVSSPDVQDPVAVRYAWANNPIISLYNQEGLPASPFRTDDWPGVTGGE